MEQATTFRSGTLRCVFLAQDRVDISEAMKVSCMSDVETESKSHDTIETLNECPEKYAVHRATWTAMMVLEDTVTRRNTSGVIGENDTYSDTAQQYKTTLDSAVQKESIYKRRMFRIWSANGCCFKKRSWQEHSSFTDEHATVSGMFCSKTLAKVATESNLETSCRKHLGDQMLLNHVQRLVRQNFARGRWRRNPERSISSRKSSLQLKRWRSSRMVQKSKDAKLR